MKTPSRLPIVRLLMFVAAVAAFTVFPGCANLSGESHTRRATSLMQYLFPGQPARTQQPAVPTLTLPLRIGVAFVPEGKAEDRGARGSHDRLPEAFKAELAKEVSSHFRELAFVQAIELIPTAYLQPGGGFANLEQIRQVFGVDVVALLSFDQSQTTDEGFWSITYWTLVGAYVVPAEKNLTATLLDAAVFDVASRKLLFRAPGISRVPGRATVMNLTEELREDSQEGFRVASTNLVVNLKTELAAFQERVKQRPDDVKIVRAPGYRSGAGTMGWGETGLLALVAALVFLGRKTGAAA